MTHTEFATKHGIKLTHKPAASNPAMPDPSMSHYRCTLSHDGKRMSLVYSKGSGHHGKPPEAGEVLNCLASDASGFLNAGGFEDWCSEYGYECEEPADARKAKKTYKAVEKEYEKLLKFLGDDLCKKLMYETEE